ncbi:Glucosyltransferase MdoH [Sulfitobacter noctilucae]|uniref:hypothetical protein n=1 Tax=Sulfitobacter noctilucae TaxID=1342302 RepID=UPI00046A2379|nr:hypothetical protein [Sulfitobacter noctilucae]KIN60152.1 Glucosyltransferase MdoH [Sulfitobacter noctilucae]
MSEQPAPANAPILAGLALLGMGLLVRRWQPRALSLPDKPDTGSHRDRGVAKVARRSRDGVAAVLPRNMTGSIGRSLLVMGAGLIIVRALDELVEDDDALF